MQIQHGFPAEQREKEVKKHARRLERVTRGLYPSEWLITLLETPLSHPGPTVITVIVIGYTCTARL